MAETGISLWAEAAVHTEEADTPEADHSADEGADSAAAPEEDEDRASEDLLRADPDGAGPAEDGADLYFPEAVLAGRVREGEEDSAARQQLLSSSLSLLLFPFS